MKLTLEQFLEQYQDAIHYIGWRNARTYRLNSEDIDDVHAELTLLAIGWYRNYYEKFKDQPEKNIAGLLMRHLSHRMQNYMELKITRHWVDAVPAHTIQTDLGQEFDWDVEDPKQLREMERVHHNWLYRVLDMLPAEDQTIICKRYGLRGQVQQTWEVIGAGAVERAMKRFRQAVKAYKVGKKPKFLPKSKRGRKPGCPNPPHAKTVEARQRVRAQILEHFSRYPLTTIPDIVAEMGSRPAQLDYCMEELLRDGIIERRGLKPRKGRGSNTRFYALISPNENGAEAGSDGGFSGTSANL